MISGPSAEEGAGIIMLWRGRGSMAHSEGHLGPKTLQSRGICGARGKNMVREGLFVWATWVCWENCCLFCLPGVDVALGETVWLREVAGLGQVTSVEFVWEALFCLARFAWQVVMMLRGKVWLGPCLFGQLELC